MHMSCLAHACNETGEIYKRKFCGDDDSFSLTSAAPSRKVFTSMLRFKLQGLAGERSYSGHQVGSRAVLLVIFPGLYESLELRMVEQLSSFVANRLTRVIIFAVTPP